jgi:hypothetical protein
MAVHGQETSNNVQNVPPVGAGEILGRLRRAEMARYIYSEIHLLEIHLLEIHLLRDTSTPGDLWESQIPMTCSFLPIPL